jgi:hypothetical protein
MHNAPPSFAEERRRTVIRPSPDTTLGRAVPSAESSRRDGISPMSSLARPALHHQISWTGIGLLRLLASGAGLLERAGINGLREGQKVNFDTRNDPRTDEIAVHTIEIA